MKAIVFIINQRQKRYNLKKDMMSHLHQGCPSVQFKTDVSLRVLKVLVRAFNFMGDKV